MKHLLKKRKGAPSVLTVGELATIMRVHPFTVTRLARQGRIKGAFRMGGVWRFPTHELLEWMKAGGDVKTYLNGRRIKKRPKGARAGLSSR